MECLQIDWESLHGSFEKDDFYENIQAPMWIDFTSPLQPADDHAWFCGRAGCTHGRKSALQALYQDTKASIKVLKECADVGVLAAIPTSRAGVANNKKARGFVSSSLSSLPGVRDYCTKDKVVQHTQLPSISECKGQSAKNLSRRQQPSENENPNRSCKAQDGAYKKSGPFRTAKFKEKKAKISIAGSTTVSQQDSVSKNVLMLEACKSSPFIFGVSKIPAQARCTLRPFDKGSSSDFMSISVARIHKTGSNCLQKTARNPHLTASLAMPIRKSTTTARLGTENVEACNPIKIANNVKVAVNVHGCRARRDWKVEDTPKQRDTQKDKKQNDQLVAINTPSTREQCTQREPKQGDLLHYVGTPVPTLLQGHEGHSSVKDEFLCPTQCQHPLQGVVGEGMLRVIQTREEDSIQDTLEKFLENLRLTSPEEDLTLNNVGMCVSNRRLAHMDCVVSLEQGAKQVAVNESDHRDAAAKCRLVEEIAAGQDGDSALEQEMVQSMRCSSHSEAASSLNGSDVTAQQMGSIDVDGTGDIILQDRQRHRGTKRKSSELNFNVKHDGGGHKRTTQPIKQSVCTARLPVITGASRAPNEDHHKKTGTTAAPLRLRTEERGAWKGVNEVSKKGQRAPHLKEVVHHALRMPSFGHPFRPQRSTKKLTVPREPKFHASKARKAACPPLN